MQYKTTSGHVEFRQQDCTQHMYYKTKQQANTIDYIHQGIIVGVGMCPLIGGGLTPIGIG